MDNLLFDINQIGKVEGTCRSCQHRERWACGGSIIQYCGVRTSNRTENGKLEIKVTMPACQFYKKEIKKQS